MSFCTYTYPTYWRALRTNAASMLAAYGITPKFDGGCFACQPPIAAADGTPALS